jgi:hypothetical protein
VAGGWFYTCNVTIVIIRGTDDKPLQHTPSKSLAEVKDIIHQILQRYRPTIQALVTKAGIEPLIPPWTPNPEMSDTVEMTFKNHIQALAIPSVEGLPSLLLHDLGSETSAISRKQAKYMTGIFSLEYHTCVDNYYSLRLVDYVKMKQSPYKHVRLR